jgi:hypothetical protein
MGILFRIVFWDELPRKIIVDNHFTWQYIPEDNSDHHTRRRENLKPHIYAFVYHKYEVVLLLYFFHICPHN